MLALLLTLSLGAESFRIQTASTTAAYDQRNTTLSFLLPASWGDTLGGEFVTAPLDWSTVEKVYLEAALTGASAASVFTLDLFSLDGGLPVLINSYEGSTDALGASFGLLELQLKVAGSGDFSTLHGFQFTWDTASGDEGALVVRSLVGSDQPIQPVIESVAWSGGTFTMTWSGTGNLPVNIQRRQSLQTGQWTAIAQGVATGQYTDTDPPAGAAFYRVVVP